MLRAAVLIAALGLSSGLARADSIEVRAADVFTKALTEIGQQFTAATQHEVKYIFKTVSLQAKEIEGGAASHVFVSANLGWMDYLAERKLIVAETRSVPVSNGLVLATPASKPAPAKIELKPGVDLGGLLGATGKLAIGDPAKVPPGTFAKQALTKLGVWSSVENRLVLGSSASETRQLLEKGDAAAGILFATDGQDNPLVHVIGVVPPDAYASSDCPAAVLAGKDTPAARAYVAFLKSPQAVATFKKYGFTTK